MDGYVDTYTCITFCIVSIVTGGQGNGLEESKSGILLCVKLL